MSSSGGSLAGFHNGTTAKGHFQWNLLSTFSHEEQHTKEIVSGGDIGQRRQFAEVVYQLQLKRKPGFLLNSLVLPNVGLSLISMLVFAVPATSRERVVLVVDLLLAMALFLTNVINILPASTEEMPFFSYFLLFTLTTLVVLTITLCYSLSIFFANSMVLELPTWLRYYVLDYLSHMVGVNKNFAKPKWLKKLHEVDTPAQHHHPKILKITTIQHKSHSGRLRSLARLAPLLLQEAKKDTGGEKFNIRWREVSEEITSVMEILKADERKKVIKQEWSCVAASLDKVFLYVTLSMFMSVFVWCFYKAVRH